jgi:hypothetical protein
MLYASGNRLGADSLTAIACWIPDGGARMLSVVRLTNNIPSLTSILHYSDYQDSREAALVRIREIARGADVPIGDGFAFIFIAMRVDDAQARNDALQRIRNDKESLRIVIEESDFDDTSVQAQRMLDRLTRAHP